MLWFYIFLGIISCMPTYDSLINIDVLEIAKRVGLIQYKADPVLRTAKITEKARKITCNVSGEDSSELVSKDGYILFTDLAVANCDCSKNELDESEIKRFIYACDSYSEKAAHDENLPRKEKQSCLECPFYQGTEEIGFVEKYIVLGITKRKDHVVEAGKVLVPDVPNHAPTIFSGPTAPGSYPWSDQRV